jgi:hypothetical protein
MRVAVLRKPPQQMALFPRLARPKPALEFVKHVFLADLIRQFVNPGWEWTHLPFGEYRPKKTAGRLKRMGVRGGWPDFLFVSPDGQFYLLELKRTNGSVVSDDQKRLRNFFIAVGVPYLLTADIPEAVARLKAWGVLRPTVRL